MPLDWDPSDDVDGYLDSLERKEPPPPLRCGECQAFISPYPDATYKQTVPMWEDVDETTGEKTGEVMVQTVGIWICRRCGHQNEWEV